MYIHCIATDCNLCSEEDLNVFVLLYIFACALGIPLPVTSSVPTLRHARLTVTPSLSTERPKESHL